MDSIEIVKLRQQVRDRESFDTFILYCFIVLSCCLLISTPFWLPSLVSSIKAFIFVSVPSIGALLFTPKCLFIVCNIIIIILIGESKHMGSNSSVDNEIYHEYVKRSATIIRTQPQLEKQEVVEDTITTIVEEKEVIIEEQGNKEGGKQVENEKQDEKVDTKLDITSSAEEKENLVEEQGNQGGENVKENGKEEEEEVALPSEELNKKFDDFIAKVRNQLRLEARQQVCL